MKAIVLEQYGGPEILRYTDVPKPKQGAGQVLVRVRAASVTPSILKRAAGRLRGIAPELAFPWVPGADFSGIVEAVGEGVTAFRAGDEVYAYGGPCAAFAQFIVIDASLLAKKPANIGHDEAASLALVGQTAWQALEECQLEAGQTLLILGAGGAVGNVAVPLAKKRGARVLAMARGRSTSRLYSLGADAVIDSDKLRFESVVDNVDVVLDLLGGDFEQRALSVLQPRGTLISVTRPADPAKVTRRRIRAVFIKTEPDGGRLAKLSAEVEHGNIKPFVGRKYPLHQTAQAWEDVAVHRSEGKIVVTIGD
ncbi:NADP-dependent oxidoreductase [Caballeronia sp. ATUFL_M1_KS5A]|uniref:NADP-dependent oxidoreductase n=1 Tax=Caballeronia sp. ATUFL_M1_KS5A TaxID=2921778 RepID=UPI002029077B|nr:NADP-dependent oxidoreductase [Caballeronia sp. ATUFL_M1_KS5A]